MDRQRKILYLDADFKLNGPVDRVTGLMIFLATAGIAMPGHYLTNEDWEKADLNEQAKGWKAVYDWAKESYGKQPWFPWIVDRVIGNFEKVLWAADGRDIHQSVPKMLADIPGMANVSVEDRNLDGAREAQQEALERVQTMMYLVGARTLFDGVSYSQPFPSYDQIGVVGVPKSAGTVSSKFNPLTIAHLAVAILTAYVQSGVDMFYIDISEYDATRKGGIENTYPQRFELAKEISELFGDMVTIWPLPADIRIWNGEEIFGKMLHKEAEVLLRTGAAERPRRAFTCGFAPDKFASSLVGFTDVTDARIRKYFQYYVSDALKPVSPKGQETWKVWQELIRQQMKTGTRKFFRSPEEVEKEIQGNSKLGVKDQQKAIAELNRVRQDPGVISVFNQALREQVLKRLANAPDKESFLGIIANAPILPNIDAFGRLVIIQAAFPEFEIVFAHTNRKEDMGSDELRDFLIETQKFAVVNVLGLDKPVAASLVRVGLLRWVYSIMKGENKFPVAELYPASAGQIQKLARDPSIIEALLFQEELNAPYAFNGMWYPAQMAAAKQSALLKLQKEIPGVMIDHGVLSEPVFDGKKYETGIAHVTLRLNNGHNASLKYFLRGKFDANGKKLYTIQYGLSSWEGDAKLVDRLKDYIKDFNRTMSNGVDVVDAAEITQEETSGSDIKGGIDFDIDNVNLDVQSEGAGMQFNFDPAVLNDGNYSGLVPVIRSVTSITDLPGFLGVNLAIPKG